MDNRVCRRVGFVVLNHTGCAYLLQSMRMPTVLRSDPYRFYFYSHEPNEPPHVHVRDDLSAKWLQPVGLARNFGFSPKELRRLEKLVTQHRAAFLGLGMGILALTADERVTDVK